MKAHSAERVWRDLLPSVVSFSAGFEFDDRPLSTTERDSLSTAGPARLREFAAGRQRARIALSALGLTSVDLPCCADGAPRWPDGIVGSIAHARSDGGVFSIAAVARRSEMRALGVDLEAPGHIAPRAWQHLLTAAELNRVLALAMPERGRAVRAIWCAKEAAAKASGGAAALREIEISLDHASGRFIASLPGRAIADASACAGRVVEASGWACAAVVRGAA